MKKLLVILVLPLMAAACNKVATTNQGTTDTAQTQQPGLSVVSANPQESIQTSPHVSGTNTESSPKISNNILDQPTLAPKPTPTPTPMPTQTPATVQTPEPPPIQVPAVAEPDFCNNISGAQSTIPAGMVRDDNGNCVMPSSTPNPTPSPVPNNSQAIKYQVQYQAVQAKIKPLEDQFNALQSQECPLSEAGGTAGIQCLLVASQAADVGEYENAIWADFLKPVTDLSIIYENKLDDLFQQIFQIKMDYAQQVANDSSHGFLAEANGEIQIATTAANAKITAINQEIQLAQQEYQNGIIP